MNGSDDNACHLASVALPVFARAALWQKPGMTPINGTLAQLMKFFVDTAEITERAQGALIDGVTTNPSLIHKGGRPFVEVVREICAIVPGPVSAEVVALGCPAVAARLRQSIV